MTAKAHIVGAEGSEVNVEGTPAEIAALMRELKIKGGGSKRPPRGGESKGTRCSVRKDHRACPSR